MKYVKMLGLLAIAAAALMAFAGTASATLTEAKGDPVDVGDTIHASSDGATSLTGSITITCQKSTVSGTVSTNGTKTASGPINTLTFTECGNHTVEVLTKGELVVDSQEGNTATVTSSGAEVTILLHSFLLGTVHCIYKTGETDIGRLTGTGHKEEGKEEVKTARLDINSVAIPRLATDGACGPESFWEGSYLVSTPDTLIVD